MWAFMISASFSHPQGLFIAHFRWSQSRVARAMRYYKLSVGRGAADYRLYQL